MVKIYQRVQAKLQEKALCGTWVLLELDVWVVTQMWGQTTLDTAEDRHSSQESEVVLRKQ